MKNVTDYENAPQYEVTYRIPAHKSADAAARRGETEPDDQARKLRAQCRTLSRSAGRFYAWSAEEAIKAAALAEKIPGGALEVHARRLEGEGERVDGLFGAANHAHA